MWQNGTGRKDGDRPAGEDQRWERPGDLGALFLCKVKAHLLTTSRGLAVVLPAAAVRPPGAAPPGLSFPAQYIPADANGGLCIGRSCADALGAWGPSATNKRHRVYTGALLATTVSTYKQRLKDVCDGGILRLYQFNKSVFIRGSLMERNAKYKSNNLCIAIFIFCSSVRVVEYFLIKTDTTVIGENVLHKVIGIIVLALALKYLNLTWSDIGFQKSGSISGILKGLLLGGVCFAFSYGLELAILALQDNPAQFEFYISSFSLTGSQVKNTDFVFIGLCVLFNIINVWMEEGVFRGLFIKVFSGTSPFMKANFIAAFLFGVWHIVMPIRNYINGDMSFTGMILMGIGYIALSGVMGIKWGLLAHMTGNMWVGLGDHLFNNTIATNMLHVISLTGADELQIIRIMAAQFISFAFVLVVYCSKTEK